MNMFFAIREFSLQRVSWLMLFLSYWIFNGIALYFQHVLLLQPCVMCIYERVAFLGIGFAALIGLAKPRKLFFRLTAIFVGLYSAIRGLLLSWQHVDYQLNPMPWNQCPIRVNFPDFLPLNEWFPKLFEATGTCSEIQWQWLGMSIPQWLINRKLTMNT